MSKNRVADDILVALEHVSKTEFVKASSTTVLGWSWGGGGALQSLSKLQPDSTSPLAAVAVYYPACGKVKKWSASIPVLILAGASDQRAPVSTCRKIVKGGGVESHVKIIEYKDARHGFDNEESRYNPDAAKMAWSELEAFLPR